MSGQATQCRCCKADVTTALWGLCNSCLDAYSGLYDVQPTLLRGQIIYAFIDIYDAVGLPGYVTNIEDTGWVSIIVHTLSI